MDPTGVIWLFWARDSFSVAHKFRLPCHIIKKSSTFTILCNFVYSASRFISMSLTVFVVSNVWSLPANVPEIGWSNQPYNEIFAQGLSCGFWLSTAENISPKRKTGHRSTAKWYDREYVACHIWEIGLLWVCFHLLTLPVGDIQYAKCTANLHRVRVVIIMIRITFPRVLYEYRQRMQLEPCSREYACCAITLSGGRFSHIFRP